jgi:ubiquinone/menaquinone biosynthesis C-methylase UbiE
MNLFKNWKESLPSEKDIYFISQDKKFTFSEEEYGSHIDLSNKEYGEGILQILKEEKSNTNGYALEIGCGNGLISVSLAQVNPFDEFIISDASSDFVKICKKNVETYSANTKNITYAVFNGDDIDKLPNNSFNAIIMANALHHINHFEEFILLIEKKLTQNGVFICQEPISDGFMSLALITKSYLSFTKKMDKVLRMRLEELVLTLSSSNRRDFDKSELEDKHIFNIYELQNIASRANLKLQVYPSMSLGSLASGIENIKSKQTSFSVMAKDYIKYCLNWEEKTKQEIYRLFEEVFEYYDTACSNSFYPPLSGVFSFKKL